MLLEIRTNEEVRCIKCGMRLELGDVAFLTNDGDLICMWDQPNGVWAVKLWEQSTGNRRHVEEGLSKDQFSDENMLTGKERLEKLKGII